MRLVLVVSYTITFTSGFYSVQSRPLPVPRAPHLGQCYPHASSSHLAISTSTY